MATADTSSAKALLDTFFSGVGLPSLSNWAWQKYLTGDSVDQIMLEVRGTPEYKARFPAMEELSKRGQAISEASYINYETGVTSLLQQYGIPKGMYDTPEGISKMLLNNVSPEEARSRIQDAAAAAYTAPQEVRTAMKDLYGVDQGGLVGYYLDSQKALPVLERQFAAAQIAGAGIAQGVGVDKTQAEKLAAQGVTYSQAVQGLGAVGQEQGLTGGFGETAANQQLIAAQFGDAAAQQATTRVVKGRLAGYSAGGNAAESATGVSGLSTRGA